MTMEKTTTSKRIFVVSVEDSSAQYLTRLVQEIMNSPSPHFDWYGLVQPEIVKKIPFKEVIPAEHMNVMGFFDVLRQANRFGKLMDEVSTAIRKNYPDVLLLMDYGGFNLRLASRMRPYVRKIIYWIPPQVWAWRQKRLSVLKQSVDLVICHFPHEKEFLESHGVKVAYFGHPLIDEFNPVLWSSEKIRERRIKTGLDPSQPLIGLLPGSRPSEIKHHLPILLKTASNLHQKYPKWNFLIPLPSSTRREEIQHLLSKNKVPLAIQQPQHPADSLAIIDVALAASGTVTLQLALLGIPQVSFYRVGTVTSWLLKFVPNQVEYFSLPNIVTKKLVIPELFQTDVTPEVLQAWVEHYLQSGNRPEKGFDSWKNWNVWCSRARGNNNFPAPQLPKASEIASEIRQKLSPIEPKETPIMKQIVSCILKELNSVA